MFEPNTRVRYTSLYISTYQNSFWRNKRKGRRGTVLRESRAPGCVRVRWDDLPDRIDTIAAGHLEEDL